MKILFVSQNYQIGGIQSSLVNLIIEISKNADVQIEILSFGEGHLKKKLPKNVKKRNGGYLLRLMTIPFKDVIKEKKIIDVLFRLILMIFAHVCGSEKLYNIIFKFKKFDEMKYDIAISFFNDVPEGYFNKGTNLLVEKFINANFKLAWMHTDPLKVGYTNNYLKNTYSNFDKIICVSNEVKNNFDCIVPELKSKTTVAYNIFSINSINKKAQEYKESFFPENVFRIVSVGRIDNKSKAFDKIPYVALQIKEKLNQKFMWIIVGDGPDLITNKELVRKLNLESNVRFIGKRNNPYPIIKESDLLVMTSNYEGYPMVIAESLILKTPVVTTRFSSVEEMIINEKNGLITGFEIDDIFSKVASIMSNNEKMKQMSEYIDNNPYTNDVAIMQVIKELKLEKSWKE